MVLRSTDPVKKGFVAVNVAFAPFPNAALDPELQRRGFTVIAEHATRGRVLQDVAAFLKAEAETSF